MSRDLTAEEQELVRRLARLSNVLDEVAAQRLVRSNPDGARELLARHERGQELQDEIARSRQRLQATVLR